MGSETRRPGPKGLPLLGVFLPFRRDPLRFCTDLAREYGDIAFFRVGPVRCVQVSRPEWIQQLLTKETARLHKSWDYAQLEVMLGKGLVTSEDGLWKRQRRLIQPAFQADRIRTYAQTMVTRTEAMLAQWRDGQALELSSAMSHLTLEIVSRALFGAEVAGDAEVIADAIKTGMDRFEAMLKSWVPLPMTWRLLPGNRRVARAVARIDEIVYRMVAERREQAERAAKPKANGAPQGAERGDDLLSWLLEARDEEGKLDDRQLRDELVTLLLAGHETTALALSWTLMELAQNPAVEASLVAELEQVLGDRSPEAADAPKLVYTRQVVEEGMRIRPPVWGFGREALEDIALDGISIPKGTQIFLMQWVVHHDPRFFPEPERFDPDRWSPERRESIPRHAYFPFGGGPRVCIGAHFARLEATLLLAAIVRRFHVELVPDQTIELQPAVTLRPKNGIRVRVHRR